MAYALDQLTPGHVREITVEQDAVILGRAKTLESAFAQGLFVDFSDDPLGAQPACDRETIARGRDDRQQPDRRYRTGGYYGIWSAVQYASISFMHSNNRSLVAGLIKYPATFRS